VNGLESELPGVATLIVFCDTFVTEPALIVNDAELLPAGIVTKAGTEATAGMLEVTVTLNPPAGAGLLMITVPVAVPPANTVKGFTSKCLTRIGSTVMGLEAATPGVAVIVLGDCEGTELVVIVNVPKLLPAGTITEAGTMAVDGFAEAGVTVNPPAGAVVLRKTVPVAV